MGATRPTRCSKEKRGCVHCVVPLVFFPPATCAILCHVFGRAFFQVLVQQIGALLKGLVSSHAFREKPTRDYASPETKKRLFEEVKPVSKPAPLTNCHDTQGTSDIDKSAGVASPSSPSPLLPHNAERAGTVKRTSRLKIKGPILSHEEDCADEQTKPLNTNWTLGERPSKAMPVANNNEHKGVLSSANGEKCCRER